MFNLLRGSGLPMPVPQYRIRDQDGNVILRADFAFVEDWLALLIDGFLQHHLPEPVRVVAATIGTVTLLSAIVCLLAYMAYDRLNS